MKYDYDLIIMGGGAAGFSALIQARKMGKEVLIINDNEQLPLGGTCVNVGCVPSKTFIELGRQRFYCNKDIDFLEALKEVNALKEGMRKRNYENIAKEWGAKQITGKAMLDNNTVVVNNKHYKAKYILIAIGAKPSIPKIEGLKNYITYREFWNLKKKPASAAIIGGGAVACELGQALNHFGIKTTIIQRSTILKNFDKDLVSILKSIMEKEGVTILEHATTERIEGDEIITSKGTVKAELIIVATGTKPDLESLGGNISIEKGHIKVDEYLRVKDNIYAAGDCTGILKLETVAAKQGKTAVENMFGKRKRINYNHIPSVVFTTPELAKVGTTEGDQRTLMLKDTARGIIRKERGAIKMFAKNKKLQGVQILSRDAGDIITIATYALKASMSLNQIREITHVFPTMAEMVKIVAQSFEENLEKLPCCSE